MRHDGIMELDDVLPRLVSTYEQGRLVPFIGAGLSAPACRLWESFVEGLEREAGLSENVSERGEEEPLSQQLVRRGNRAVRHLKRRGSKFPEHLRAALFTDSTEIPPQTSALARLWWPLVLTTNYDNCFAASFVEQHRPRKLDVVGRSQLDCQRILTSLTEPSRSLLWALQGYIDGPCGAPWSELSSRKDFERQLVVGHEEYRRVTYRDIDFRRAFAEVFRSRSLFFLGSGIRESYLQELFGEILEIYGPSGRQHFALMRRDEAYPEFVHFMSARFQTIVVPYNDHEELPGMLGRLSRAVETESRRPIHWTFGRASSKSRDERRHRADLEVVRGRCPLTRGEGELAVSAGGTGGSYFFTTSIERKVLPAWDVDGPKNSDSAPGDDTGALGFIYEASKDLFKHTAERGYCRILMQLLASGGKEPRFPERFAFIQIVRAFGDWLRKNRDAQLQVSLFLVSPPVYLEIASGRLDVLELLTCPDIRFWTEILDGHTIIERRIFTLRPREFTLGHVAEHLDLPRTGWQVEIIPAPSLGISSRTVEKDYNTELFLLGLVPGSTLRFTRV